MQGIKHIAQLLVVAVFILAGSTVEAPAAEKTKVGAQHFMSASSAAIVKFRGLKNSSQYVEFELQNPITVTAIGNCKTRFSSFSSSKNSVQPDVNQVDVNWAAVTQVDKLTWIKNGNETAWSVTIYGGLHGYDSGKIFLNSAALRERFLNAAEFLRAQCDAAGGTGF